MAFYFDFIASLFILKKVSHNIVLFNICKKSIYNLFGKCFLFAKYWRKFHFGVRFIELFCKLYKKKASITFFRHLAN